MLCYVVPWREVEQCAQEVAATDNRVSQSSVIKTEETSPVIITWWQAHGLGELVVRKRELFRI